MSFRDISPGPEMQGRHGHPGGSRSSTPQRRKGGTDSPLRRSSSINHNRPVHSPQYQQSGVPFARSQSDSRDYHHHHEQSTSTADDDNRVMQSLAVQQREEEYALRTMQQREEEMRDIHRKMHVVNEIYKDLGEVVEGQQDRIDSVEDQFSGAAEATRRGLEQIEKANAKSSRKGRGRGGAMAQSDGTEKKQQFFLLRYLTKSANEITKLVSACGGQGSAGYVDDRDWKK